VGVAEGVEVLELVDILLKAWCNCCGILRV